MTIQLTPAQHAILAKAINTSAGKIEWFPDNIKGGARKKVLDGLFNRPPLLQKIKHISEVAPPQGPDDPLRHSLRTRGCLMKMKPPVDEREQALCWLITNRRPKQAVRVMSIALPRDLATMQLLRRIAEEEEAKETSRGFNWRTPPRLPPRG